MIELFPSLLFIALIATLIALPLILISKSQKNKNAQKHHPPIELQQTQTPKQSPVEPQTKEQPQAEPQTLTTPYPYKRKYLLTKNEWQFYKSLKPIADKYNLQILSKIRLADIIEVIQPVDNRTWGIYFNKIKSKHIDFALANPQNLYIEFLIELDDYTHNRQKRIDRDKFVDDLCAHTGYILIHSHGDVNKIQNIIETTKKQNTYKTSKELTEVNS